MANFIAALPNRLRRYSPAMGRVAERAAASTSMAARWPELLLVGFAYLVVALLVRGGTLGFPILHIDEQFYLLVGDRMLHGALPFVDIWDRKPVGLFLLYAAIRLLGGTGVLQYQLVALGCAAATSLVIYRIAREVASRPGAWWAGVAYQLYLSAYLCFGGQAPVFYNLLVALAGLGMLRIHTDRDRSRLFVHGLAVMALIGVALQIKYTVVFEGMAFGIALIWRARRVQWHPWAIAGAALAWCMMALLPTIAAWAYYAAIGYGPEFMQANFLSIFGRHENFSGSLFRLFKEMLALTPAWVAIFVVPRYLPTSRTASRPALNFLRFWGVAAMLGFLIFGTWYDHYVAPLLVPVMALCAPALGRTKPFRWVTIFIVAVAVIAAAVVTIYNTRRHGTTEQVDHAAAMIRAAAGDGCLYINEGDPIFYHLTGACLATRYVFPNHLNGMVDVDALGVNASVEVARIMASRPRAVVMTVRPSAMPVNWETRAMIFKDLARDYDLYGMTTVGWRGLLIYRLKPEPVTLPAPVATPNISQIAAR